MTNLTTASVNMNGEDGTHKDINGKNDHHNDVDTDTATLRVTGVCGLLVVLGLGRGTP